MLFSLQAVSNKNCLLSGCPLPGTNNLAALLIPICWLSVRADRMERQQIYSTCSNVQGLNVASKVIRGSSKSKWNTHTEETNQSRSQSSRALCLFVVIAHPVCVCVCALVFIMRAYCSEYALTEEIHSPFFYSSSETAACFRISSISSAAIYHADRHAAVCDWHQR